MSYLDPQTAGGSGATVSSIWKFSTSIVAADPGAKFFRYNNATPANVTEIYINSESNNKGDLDNVLSFLRSGDQIYIQQGNDATRAILVTCQAAPVDNTGWWTIPVSVIASGTLPGNNAECPVLMNFGAGSQGETPLIALRQSSVLRVNSTVMVDDTVLTLPLEASTVYEVSMSLRFNRLAGAPASSLKFNFNNTFTLTQASMQGESTLLNVHGADYNVIPDNSAADTIVDPLILGVQYRWIASGVIIPATAGNWVLEFAQNVATTTACSLIAGSYLKAVKIGTEA